MSSPPIPLSPAPVTRRTAEVRVHDSVMRYHRTGHGRPVLILLPNGEAGLDQLWPGLLDLLAARFRVIVPEVEATGGDVARWLGAFLEGLGVTDAGIIATDSFCMPCLELALRDADQVTRVVLVPGGSASETGLGGTLGTRPGGAGVPLLVVRRDLPTEEALAMVSRFLGIEG